MKILKTDVAESMSTTQKKNFYINSRTLPSFEDRQFIYVNRPPRSFVATGARNLAAASYNKLISQVSGRYETVAVRDIIVIILENGKEITITTDRASWAPVLDEIHHVNTYNNNDVERQPLTRST